MSNTLPSGSGSGNSPNSPSSPPMASLPAVPAAPSGNGNGSAAASSPASIITQVKQTAAPANSAKSTIEAAKKRAAKLEVATNGTPAAPSSSQKDDGSTANHPPASGKTPLPPSPHTNLALTAMQTGAQQPAPIAVMAAKSKKQKAGSGSFWSTLFPCCCAPMEDEPTAVPMAPVAKQTTVVAKPSPIKAKPAQPESRKWLLKPLAPEDAGRKCLVLDLDETLVHSSFKPVAKADFVIPVEIDKTIHNVYVLKRPGVDTFLQRLGPQFEVVVFTASLAKYADPVLDMLDKHKVIKHRLFREACIHHKGNYVKDLSLLGRDLKDVIIIDNSPSCYMFHPANAIPISSWFDEPNDTELLDLIPFLEDLKLVENVTVVLDNSLDD